VQPRRVRMACRGRNGRPRDAQGCCRYRDAIRREPPIRNSVIALSRLDAMLDAVAA